MARQRKSDIGTGIGQGLQSFAHAYMQARQMREQEARNRALQAIQQANMLLEYQKLAQNAQKAQQELALKLANRQQFLEQWENAINALAQGDVFGALKGLGPYAMEKGDISKLIALRYGEQGIGTQTPFAFGLTAPHIIKIQEGTTTVTTPSITGELPPGMAEGIKRWPKTATPSEVKPRFFMDPFGNIKMVSPSGVKQLEEGIGKIISTPGGGQALYNPIKEKKLTAIVPGVEKSRTEEMKNMDILTRLATAGRYVPMDPKEMETMLDAIKEIAKKNREEMTPSLPGGVRTFSTEIGDWLDLEDQED